MKAYEITENPELFKKTEWGHLDLDITSYLDHRIIENRNNFVEIFGIMCSVNLLLTWGDTDEFSHVESYIDKKGEFVLLCSLHGNSRPPARLGMREIMPVFTQEARTYMRRFASYHEFEAVIAESDLLMVT